MPGAECCEPSAIVQRIHVVGIRKSVWAFRFRWSLHRIGGWRPVCNRGPERKLMIAHIAKLSLSIQIGFAVQTLDPTVLAA